MSGRPLKIAVLLSGSGTTLQNLFDARDRGELPVEFVLVVASKPEAFGLERARRAGIAAAVERRKDYPDTAAYSAAVFGRCREAEAELIVMAGFLQLLAIPEDFRRRVMNIHPSLLPAFGGRGMHGRHVHEAALKRGVKISGCTVHFADDEYDHGEILVQRAVPVSADDTPETLAARVFVEECIAYPEAIRGFIQTLLPQISQISE